MKLEHAVGVDLHDLGHIPGRTGTVQLGVCRSEDYVGDEADPVAVSGGQCAGGNSQARGEHDCREGGETPKVVAAHGGRVVAHGHELATANIEVVEQLD